MRPSIVETMMNVAKVLATRGTCAKKQVGCVIVDKDFRILSTGYNGQPKGEVHCTSNNPCPAAVNPAISCNAIHAEMNAIMFLRGSNPYAIFITERPCDKCNLLIRNSTIEKVYYLKEETPNLIYQG